MHPDIFSLTDTVVPQLRLVDELLRKSLLTSVLPLQDMVDHLPLGEGKKIRPLLVLLSGAIFEGNDGPAKTDALLKTAVAVELIHTASLVHDDIIDGAFQRRGQTTLHGLYNSQMAVLAGDYLLSRAFYILSNLDQSKILVPLMARSVALLCRGEARQLDKVFDWNISEQEYFRCNYLKTSQFLAACCEAGGRIAAALPLQVKALCEYGFNLGQAFQVVDDILDFTDEIEHMGKTVGVDLGQGVITLPLIYLLRNRGRYRALLGMLKTRRGPLPVKIMEEIRRAVKESGALNYSAFKAEQAKISAIRALQTLPQTDARCLLARIAEAVIGRIV